MTTDFIYDRAGHLLAEANHATGAMLREYIWMDDLPVAMVDDTGSSPVIYYIHADQLGSPQKLTDSLGSIVWDGVFDPFGDTVPITSTNWGAANWGSFNWSTNPAFAMPLRFPGQYADAETALNQNWFRDYDPTIGRYVESDPIGLASGTNIYTYVSDNPLRYVDPLGLTWADDARMFWGWVSGSAPPMTVYGPGTNQSKDMMQSQGVADAVRKFNQKNAGKCPRQRVPVTHYDYKFGLTGLWQAGSNSTQQFVGSYSVNVFPNANGTVNVDVYNTTSMTSFFYGIYPNALNPRSGWPMGNTSQEYEGVLPASTGATNCGCKTGS